MNGTRPTHEIILVSPADGPTSGRGTDSPLAPVLVPIGAPRPRFARSEFRAEGPCKTRDDDLREWVASVGGWVMPGSNGPRPEIHAYSGEIVFRGLPVRYFRDRRGRTVDAATGRVVHR